MIPDRRLLRIPVGDAVFGDLKALIVARTGHHYYEDKEVQLGERIARRMSAIGLTDPRLYLERLRDDAAGPREWRQLESELTIKETFFFRFAEQFAALRNHILPGLIARHAEDRHLRLWSAGCSTGAEPYSLAVELRDLLGEAADDWRISILGTDIDEAALVQARQATYGGWALRVVDEPERARLFETDGPRWRLRAPYRGMVRFERQNILDLLDPLAPIGHNDYDLILCRNLLIYFRPDIGTRLVSALGERLAAHGRLLLGHAEAGVAVDSEVLPIEMGGTVTYARALKPDADADLPGRSTVHASFGPVARRRPARRASRREPSLSPGVSPPARDSRIGEIRELLARGETLTARTLIGEARLGDARDPLLLYLEGLGAAAEGEHEAAEKAFRGALYLDPGLAMAHYLLGRQLLESGRAADGRRALANAARAIAAYPDDAPVPEGEGMTATDLRDAIRHRLNADRTGRP